MEREFRESDTSLKREFGPVLKILSVASDLLICFKKVAEFRELSENMWGKFVLRALTLSKSLGIFALP